MKLKVLLLILKTLTKYLFKLNEYFVNICDLLNKIFKKDIYEIISDGLCYYRHLLYVYFFDTERRTLVPAYEKYRNVEADDNLMNIEISDDKVKELLQIIGDRVYDHEIMPDNHKDLVYIKICSLKNRYIKKKTYTTI